MNYSYDTYKPTKNQIIIPIIVLVVTLMIGGILLLIARSLGDDETKISFLAPSTQVFNIEEPGNYTIYLTTQIKSDEMSYHLPKNFKGLYTELTFNKERVALTKIDDGYTYGDEDNLSESYLSFEVSEPGEYHLTTRVEGESIQELALAMGKTEKNLDVVLMLGTCALLLILMGVCQFIAYTVFNLGRWFYYYYKSKNI